MIQLQPAKCPCCGANIHVNEELTKTICQYCGTEVLIQEAIHKYKIEITGKIEVDGISTEKNQLIRAKQLLDMGQYDNANSIYKNVLKLSPTNYEAWWGIYLCESAISKYYGYTNNLGDTSPQIKADILEKNLYKYAYKAIEYADDDKKSEYKNQIASIEKYIEEIRHPIYNKRTLKDIFRRKSK